jgi:hypothetical protein
MSELLKFNVNDHTEKKANLTYLSWAWAWSKILEIDPQATWEVMEFEGLPVRFLPDRSAMVKTVVTLKGHAKSCWLPVMNHRNQAIKEPDAFAINTAIMRCMTKAISMHGLGLYIYAGEDLPSTDADAHVSAPRIPAMQGIGNDLPIEKKQLIEAVALAAIEKFEKDDFLGAYEECEGIKEIDTGNDEKLYLWKLLPSKLRTAITKHSASLKGEK